MVKIVLLGIIHRRGEVLIGRRKEQDEYIKHLTWVFPGGETKTLDLESEIRRIVKEETGLSISVNGVIGCRRPAESKIDIILVYFNCTPTFGDGNPGGDLSELKWVPATQVCKYFTTPVANDVMGFLRWLEEKKT